MHLRTKHFRILLEEMVFDNKNTSSIYEQLIAGSTCFDPLTFCLKLLRAIAVLHLPFSIVENDKFKDLMLYLSPNLRGNDTLPKSSNTIKILLLQMFIIFKVMLIALLLKSRVKVYISFNLWTSPNGYFMLGIVCYFINLSFKAYTILFSLNALYRLHSSENIATLLVQIIKDYYLQNRLGFCILDNASNNDTSLLAIF